MSLNVVILTGAGISAESGLPTFRDSNGLWEGHHVEDVATPEAFERNPVLVHRFYNLRRAAVRLVQPNAAHLALARLQNEHLGRVTLITQNVDDLHERAGSGEVIHMHGNVMETLCASCRETGHCDHDMSELDCCSSCRLVGHMRPNIVWFGEIPYHLDTIQSALHDADIFAAIGTSGQVYPAAGFVRTVPENTITVEINNQSTSISRDFMQHRIGPATEIVPKWVDQLLAGVL